MSVINSTPLIAAGDDGYTISRSVRLRSSASAYFSRTPASAGNRRTWTWSGWVKLGALGQWEGIFNAGSSGNQFAMYLYTDSQIYIQDYTGSNNLYLQTTQVFRDSSAWYHVVLAVDTTQATSSNRAKLYINGTQVTTFASSTYPSQNYDTQVNSTSYQHNLGLNYQFGTSNAKYFDGYMTEVNFIDGQALTPSSFGETDTITGVWKPKRYTGTYGTNGFYLNFSDNSNNTAATIGKDSSGNGNNWTPNNISVTSGVTYDSMLDTPTPYADGGNGRGNYAVLNPLNLQGSVTSGTITEANLKSNPSSSAGFTNYLSSIAAPSSGYWYAEFTVSGTYQGANSNAIGLQPVASKSTYALGYDSFSYGYWDGDRTTGSFKNNNTTSQSPAGFQTGDTLMIAFGNGNVWFGKNGAWLGTGSPNPATATSPAYSGLSGDFYIGYSAYGTSGVTYGYNSFANFGQRPFAHTPPTGFKALNTYNLPDSTITKGSAYFDVSTWTGAGQTGASSITGLNFAPDFVWVKSRSVYANSHLLYDSVRGASTSVASKALQSNATSAEGSVNDNATYGYLSAFNSDGFSYFGGSSPAYFSGNTAAYVGWQWKESVSAGFDIVTYTGTGSATTVAHSLGVAPSMVIVKQRAGGGTSGVNDWVVSHTSLTSGTYFIRLNTTAAQQNSATVFSAFPSSTVISIGTDSYVNASTGTYVAYCFAQVAGYSKFGSYTGNGSADGPFVYLGFRPRFIMFKRTDSTGDWIMFDTSRDTYNYADKQLLANSSAAEAVTGGGYVREDFLSNGFKVRGADSYQNASGGTYIYAAFAENPFKNSLAR